MARERSNERSDPESHQQGKIATQPRVSQQDGHDIFVRAHTSVRAENRRRKPWVRKWPRHCLIFDTETTVDTIQDLNFGVYRRCELVRETYRCVAEGIFYRDDIAKSDLELLQRYSINPKTSPSIEHFPAP